jgi:hypothetical protein
MDSAEGTAVSKFRNRPAQTFDGKNIFRNCLTALRPFNVNQLFRRVCAKAIAPLFLKTDADLAISFKAYCDSAEPLLLVQHLFQE